MKPIETAEVARAIANIATAKGVASTVPMVDALLDRMMRDLQGQMRKQGVQIDQRRCDG